MLLHRIGAPRSAVPRPDRRSVFYRGGMARTRSTRSVVTRLVAATVAASLVTACTGGDDGAAPTIPSTTTTTIPNRVNDGVLTLGAYLPRTGPGAVLGEPMIDAIMRAVGEINSVGGVLGEDVVLRLFDENSGVSMGELVLDGGIDAIVGPASSNVALAQLDEVVQSGTGVVTCSPTASALALDDFPDNGYFFRTIPSDSVLMSAMARRVASTGAGTVVVAYLDDLYGRGLFERFRTEASARGVEVGDDVGFSPDDEDLRPVVTEILASSPAVIVVLADADDGTRLLAELDTLTEYDDDRPQVIVNEAVREGRQTIQTLSDSFREQLTGVAPRAQAQAADFTGSFTANAVDCVNLIALAAEQAGSDLPRDIRSMMAAVSDDGAQCGSFDDCATLMKQGLQINYNGLSGPVEISSTTGDLERGWFEVFAFTADGSDEPLDGPLQAP
jgi:branched-chain amino acid transport system substrate-binding protein